MDIHEIYLMFRKLQADIEEAEDYIDKLKEKLELVTQQILYYMDINNVQELSFDDGHKLKFKVDVIPNVLVKDNDRLRAFLGEDADVVFNDRPTKLKSYINNNYVAKGYAEDLPTFINLFIKEDLKHTKPRKGK